MLESSSLLKKCRWICNVATLLTRKETEQKLKNELSSRDLQDKCLIADTHCMFTQQGINKLFGLVFSINVLSSLQLSITSLYYSIFQSTNLIKTLLISFPRFWLMSLSFKRYKTELAGGKGTDWERNITKAVKGGERVEWV